jgi:hypothetical protein
LGEEEMNNKKTYLYLCMFFSSLSFVSIVLINDFYTIGTENILGAIAVASIMITSLFSLLDSFFKLFPNNGKVFKLGEVK